MSHPPVIYILVIRIHTHEDRYILQKKSLTEGEYTVGREDDNDIVIERSSVSRKQCRLAIDNNGTIKVTDCDSRNGTYIGSGDRKKQVFTERTVMPDQVISLGHSVELALVSPDDTVTETIS